MSLQPDLLRYIAVSPVGPVPQEPRGTGSPLSRGSEVSPPSIPLSYVLTWLLHLTKPNSFLLCLKPIHRNIGPAEPESYSQRLDLHTYHCIKKINLFTQECSWQISKAPMCVWFFHFPWAASVSISSSTNFPPHFQMHLRTQKNKRGRVNLCARYNTVALLSSSGHHIVTTNITGRQSTSERA